MIENANATSNHAAESYEEMKKYEGVASISILGVNPNKAMLRLHGWPIAEDAEEPKYVTVNADGKKSARVRFLVKIEDLDDKPVIPLDFWVRSDIQFNKDQTKCQVIDAYGRTAYGTKSEIQGHLVPQYANGPANISQDYKPCHVGEEALVAFLMKFLNVTPLQTFKKETNSWVNTKNPGRLTFDHWGELCNGNVREVQYMLSQQPENRVKVILGIRTTDDNKSYQTFLNTLFISNGARVDAKTGEYASARKAIDRWAEYHSGSTFSAAPVREWKQTPTEVADNSSVEDMPDFSSPEYITPKADDLPFE